MGSIRMRALALCAMLAILLSAGGLASANGTTKFVVGDLIAGQHDVIGHITATKNCATGMLTVTFTVDDSDWEMTKTHLYVGTKPPRKHSPGRFPYQNENLADGQSDSYTVDVGSADCLYIAAHADVRYEDATAVADVDDFCASLPAGLVDLVATRSAPWVGASYLGVNLANAGEYNGFHDGWCIDVDTGINLGQAYAAEMICTYNLAGMTGIVEQPGNADKVNYILNQGYVGKTAGVGGVFTFSDVQRALWHFFDDNNSTAGLEDWDPARVEEIIVDANANGAGFEPECDELVGVALNPIDSFGTTIAQVLLFGIPLSCTTVFRNETAWAYGNDEFDKGWGWYHKYSLCP